jgi:hypothetical protein
MDSNLTCLEENRRKDVRMASLLGLDYVEVADTRQLTLNVFFLGKAPANIELANVVLTGGRRIRDVKIVSLRAFRQSDPTLDDYLELKVDKPGDFSAYTLSLVKTVNGVPTGQPMDGFDARYSQVDFSFKTACPTDLDCKTQISCPPPLRPQPDINYLAKDYESFRQLILDRLALIMPAWTETHTPDLGITLVELLAYAGDYLSYFQDAVATEAYLGTARERISVRRHARLVDYLMHEGCDSRAWLTIATDTDWTIADPTQIYFITPYPGAPDRKVLTPADLLNIPLSGYEIFEPLYWNGAGGISVYKDLSRIDFYTWGDCRCCLAPGSTEATLIDAWDAAPAGNAPQATDQATSATADGPPGAVRRLRNLAVGDILIFQEVIGPNTGNPADADPTHRQAVRLTKVTPNIDPLYGQPQGTPVLEIQWAAEDALQFPLCISSQQPPPDCGCLKGVSIACGNVILVDNGSDTTEVAGTVPTRSAGPECPKCCEPAGLVVTPCLFRPKLSQQSMTFSVPLPPACSALSLLAQDPRQALPDIELTSIPPAPDCPTSSDPSQPQPPCEIPALFTFDDLTDPTGLAKALAAHTDTRTRFLLGKLTIATQTLLAAWDAKSALTADLRAGLIADLSATLEIWTPQRDLLESGPDDASFVVEMDNDGFAQLRFGDGVCGRQPDAGTLFKASYRVGNGTAGNVGRDTITYVVLRSETLSGVALAPTNPLAASGGVDPEPIDDVKEFAPYAFRSQIERAITADDYATLASDTARRLANRAALEVHNPEICTANFTPLQGAKAALRWNGSWYTALVALDPQGSEVTDSELVAEVTGYLEPFRRMGDDLLVSPATYVPIKLGMTLCVLPNYQRGHVEAAALDALSDRALSDGTLGFFHPDNLTFGADIDVSRLLATVQAIPGVQNCMVTELERLDSSDFGTRGGTPDELPIDSALRLGPFEIAQLDNDPSFPENGLLILDVRGGR